MPPARSRFCIRRPRCAPKVRSPTGCWRCFTPGAATWRASRAISEGIGAGADPVALNIALAGAAWKAGDRGLAGQALDRAVHAGPIGFDDNLRIGVMYLDCEKFSRAIGPLKKAIAADPEDPDGYYYLAAAEQNSYDFATAAAAFKKALALAPERSDIKDPTPRSSAMCRVRAAACAR